MKPTIVYIHGFNSTSRSFAYIEKMLPEHTAILVNYDSHQPLLKSLQQVHAQLPSGSEIHIVGHSLGGVIATLLAASDEKRFSTLSTISSPLGGVRSAQILKWVPGAPAMVKDLSLQSLPITQIKNMRLTLPTLSIISTGGHLMTSREPNDSIVTVPSQVALQFGEKAEVKASHFEVMLHERTVQLLRKHIFGDQS